jgi:prepilin-type processing-associated H-X9-DG protein
MPYGFYWNRSINHLHAQGHPDPYNPANTWAEARDNAGSMGDAKNEHPSISWASMVGKHVVRRANGDDARINFPPVLRCPEAAQSRPHLVGYIMNITVGISPMYELQVGSPPQAQLKPPVITQMLKETALVWDTAVRPNWQDDPGHLVSADLDGQRFWLGAGTPQYRYYNSKDPFGRLPPGVFGQNRPVQLDVGSFRYFNRDPGPTDTDRFPYQGNLRFRHGGDTTCNVGFADGSVRQFTGKFKSDKTLQSDVPNRSHDALRRYFMIKWPPGVPPAPGVPH